MAGSLEIFIPMPVRDLTAIRESYLAAQLAGDQRAALRLIREAIAEGQPVSGLREEVIREAQLEIGRLWQENKLSVAHEHMATAISQMALVQIFEHADIAPARGVKVVVACVEGEQHDFPARLVADHLEMAGFDVRFLGANVPTDSLISVLTVEAPHVLALSVTMSFNAGGLRAAVERVRGRFPRLPIVAGGHALRWSPALADKLGVIAGGGPPEELVRIIASAAAEAAA